MDPRILHRQGRHLLAWIVLGFLQHLAIRAWPDTGAAVLGLTCSQWIRLGWIAAGLHQFWIAMMWRLELHGGRVSRAFGPFAFTLHRIGFLLFGFVRANVVFPVALASCGTLSLPDGVRFPLLAVGVPLALWALHDTVRYFGISRAMGADHFDPSYRRRGFERKGLFGHLNNVMYVVVLTYFYHPGLVWNSAPALVVAACQHAFVWTHYWCTERPDLAAIYGTRTR